MLHSSLSLLLPLLEHSRDDSESYNNIFPLVIAVCLHFRFPAAQVLSLLDDYSSSLNDPSSRSAFVALTQLLRDTVVPYSRSKADGVQGAERLLQSFIEILRRWISAARLLVLNVLCCIGRVGGAHKNNTTTSRKKKMISQWAIPYKYNYARVHSCICLFSKYMLLEIARWVCVSSRVAGPSTQDESTTSRDRPKSNPKGGKWNGWDQQRLDIKLSRQFKPCIMWLCCASHQHDYLFLCFKTTNFSTTLSLQASLKFEQ